MTELDTRFSFDQYAAPHTLCQSLFDFLLEQQLTFEHRLTPDLSHIDSQAHTIGRPELLRVEHIQDHQFHLYYQIKWQFFHGCSDKSDSGVSEEKVRFSLRNPGEIDIHFPICHQRDTQDEF